MGGDYPSQWRKGTSTLDFARAAGTAAPATGTRLSVRSHSQRNAILRIRFLEKPSRRTAPQKALYETTTPFSSLKEAWWSRNCVRGEPTTWRTMRPSSSWEKRMRSVVARAAASPRPGAWRRCRSPRTAASRHSRSAATRPAEPAVAHSRHVLAKKVDAHHHAPRQVVRVRGRHRGRPGAARGAPGGAGKQTAQNGRPGARAQAGADFRRPEGGCPKVEIPAVQVVWGPA